MNLAYVTKKLIWCQLILSDEVYIDLTCLEGPTYWMFLRAGVRIGCSFLIVLSEIVHCAVWSIIFHLFLSSTRQSIGYVHIRDRFRIFVLQSTDCLRRSSPISSFLSSCKIREDVLSS